MKVRRFFVRLLNLVYLAGAGIAVYGLATKPLLSLAVSVEVPGSFISSFIQEQAVNASNTSKAMEPQYRADIKRDDINTGDMDIVGMLADVDMDGVFQGLSLDLNITMPSFMEFAQVDQEDQAKLIGKVVETTFNNVKDSAIDVLVTGFNNLVPELAKAAAKAVIGPAIGEQIANVMNLTSDDPEVQAKLEMVSEEVGDLVNNVWNTLTDTKTAANSFKTYEEALEAAQGTPENWANGDIIEVKASDDTPEEEIKYYTYNNPRKFTKLDCEEEPAFKAEYESLSAARDAAKAADPAWEEGYIVKITGDSPTYYSYEVLTLRNAGLATTIDDVMGTISESVGDVFQTLADAGVEGFTSDDGSPVEFNPEDLDEIKDSMGDMLAQVGLADPDTGEIKDINEALSMMLEMFMGGGGDDHGGSQTGALNTPNGARLEQGGFVVWNEVSGADHYEVTVNGSEPTTVTEAKYQGTEVPGSYEFSVVACPAEGDTEHENSNPYTFTVVVTDQGAHIEEPQQGPELPPIDGKLPAPTNVLYDQGDHSLRWDGSKLAIGYSVQVDEATFPAEEPYYQLPDALQGGEAIMITAVAPDPAYSSDPFIGTAVENDGVITIEEVAKSIIHRATRADEPATTGGTSDDQIRDLINQFIDPLLAELPMDEITGINIDEMVGMAGATFYAYAALIGLAALPWLLFALFTFFRTLRVRKCWAKPWFVFLFAFLEVILGAGITLGIKYGLPLALPAVTGMLPPDAAKFAPVLAGVSISFEMNCLWASYIYLAMIPFTIIYAIFAHGVKKDFKIYKKSKKYAKKILKGSMTMDQVADKYKEETARIVEKKSKKAKAA